MNKIKQKSKQSDTLDFRVSICWQRIETTFDFRVSTPLISECRLKKQKEVYGATPLISECRDTLDFREYLYIYLVSLIKMLLFLTLFLFSARQKMKNAPILSGSHQNPPFADNFYRVFPAYFSRCLAILFYGG